MDELVSKADEFPNKAASELSGRLGEVCEHGSLKRKCQICELKERVEELENRLRDIGDIAHAQSTGPAEPDWLWSIRELAYELL